MRLLFFITLLAAILFSEVVTHVITWESDISVEYEIPSDESNESESSEENQEDNVEKDKLFEDIAFYSMAKLLKFTELPCSYNALFSQSLREIHSPPPDKA